MTVDVASPAVVRREERRPATDLPIGSSGEEVFHDPAAWLGVLELAPGAASGWHHHGDWDSYAYVIEGVLRWEYGPGGGAFIQVTAGDVGRMPARLVHRDVSAGDTGLKLVLFRTGQGQLTIDVPGPPGLASGAASPSDASGTRS
jgi:uncharacterized RmlC-like cupin family protein